MILALETVGGIIGYVVGAALFARIYFWLEGRLDSEAKDGSNGFGWSLSVIWPLGLVILAVIAVVLIIIQGIHWLIEHSHFDFDGHANIWRRKGQGR